VDNERATTVGTQAREVRLVTEEDARDLAVAVEQHLSQLLAQNEKVPRRFSVPVDEEELVPLLAPRHHAIQRG